MADIKPYTIAVDDQHLKDLKTRLSLAKFPDELDEAEWDSEYIFGPLSTYFLSHLRWTYLVSL